MIDKSQEERGLAMAAISDGIFIIVNKYSFYSRRFRESNSSFYKCNIKQS